MRKLVIFLTLFAALFTANCGKESKKEKKPHLPSTHLEVVATTGIIADIVRSVGRDLVGVTVLMEPNTDPHLYRPNKDDLALMAGSDLVFCNGLNLEAAMAEDLKRLAASVRVVAVTEDIDTTMLLKSRDSDGQYDPHVWHDVRMWMIAVEHVRNVLVEMDPDYGDVYFDGALVYTDEIARLHNFVHTETQQLPVARRLLVTAHDAFHYFGRAFGFDVRGLQGINTALDAAPTAEEDLAEFIMARGIPVVFTEACVSPAGIERVQSILADRGFEVRIGGPLYADAIGSLETPQGTYIGMVEHNVQVIVNALKDDRGVVMP
jgi:manganese/zinc/iron transport system substrate-binding protein